MASHENDTDTHTARLDLLSGLLQALDFSPNATPNDRKWEFDDGSQSKHGATLRLHSPSAAELAIVAAAFDHTGIETSLAHRGESKFVMIPEENFGNITGGYVHHVEQQISAHVMAEILNDEFSAETQTGGKWHHNPGRGGTKAPNARIQTDGVMEALNLSRELKNTAGLNAKVKHKRNEGSDDVQYMVVIEMDNDPGSLLKRLKDHVSNQSPQASRTASPKVSHAGRGA